MELSPAVRTGARGRRPRRLGRRRHRSRRPAGRVRRQDGRDPMSTSEPDALGWPGTSHAHAPIALAVVTGLCSLALFAPLLWPLLTGRIFGYNNDLGLFHLPLRAEYQNGLRSAGSFLWTPSLFPLYYFPPQVHTRMFH